MRAPKALEILVLALGCMLIVLFAARRDDSLTQPPTYAVAVVFVVAVALLVSARSLRLRLRGGPGSKAITPLAAARMAVLGLTATLSSAVIGGCWLGLLLDRLARLSESDAATPDAVVASLGVVSGAVLLTAGLVLQRITTARED